MDEENKLEAITIQYDVVSIAGPRNNLSTFTKHKTKTLKNNRANTRRQCYRDSVW